ncbi:MAG TPA: M13 family metallopeptidase N-terminal domain-containing protein, partial [Rhizomicrobium sp.]
MAQGNKRNRLIRSAGIGAALAAMVTTAQARNDAPVYPPFGLDLTARDAATKPGDDFFQYANGAYLARAVIPADQPMITRRSDMTDRIDAHLHTILDDAARAVPLVPRDTKGKVGAFYAAFMDEASIESKGIGPIEPELSAIRRAPGRAALANLMGRSAFDFYPSPFFIVIDSDLKDTSRYAVYLWQSGLGLPDRDYYLKPDLAKQKDAYRLYAANLLKLAGWPNAAKAAAAVVEFETRLADASWTKVQQRDPTTQYNPMTPAQLAAYAPGFSWRDFLAGAQLSKKT